MKTLKHGVGVGWLGMGWGDVACGGVGLSLMYEE